ncbi:hypothetical protein GCM10011425_29260 [Mucilaginibacter galii]|uniref:Uncharacterized protein n=1 Tax=Mucilaginibacter galii TaxID=2005073 RepID=A0A917JAU6_9SPHI|nr:hypothetical protein GCM10011425_29260 [Mucilaginibacter galii]
MLNGKLYVAHERKEILEERTLANLYLKPLVAMFNKNNQSEKSYINSTVRDVGLEYQYIIRYVW